MEINYDSELFSSYKEELDLCSSLSDFQNLIFKYSVVSPDLKEVKLETQEEYSEFLDGYNLEKQKIFSGEDWCSKYASIILPYYIFYAQLLADKYGVPWGVAYLRMCAENYVPGIDPELAKQEIFKPLEQVEV